MIPSDSQLPVGRPTDYTPELLAKCYDYLDNYESLGDKIPSHVGLAITVGISKTCMYRWSEEEDKKEFKDILGQCKVMQERKLLSNGLDNTFNSAITKLVLGKHGYHDKQDTIINANIGLHELSDEELARKRQALELSRDKARRE